MSEDDASDGIVALAAAETGYAVGLLWRPERPGRVPIRPIRSMWSPQGRTSAGFWHALAIVGFDIGGRTLRVASYHADPFNPEQRVAEAHQVRRFLCRAGVPSVVGADWNAIFANPDTDPDPYTEWTDEFVHQVRLEIDEAGRPAWTADRRPAVLLEAGGLPDPAPQVTSTPAPTTGHWPNEPFPPRRVDGFRVTRNLRPAVVSCSVHTAASAKQASDHLPVIMTLDLARLSDNAVDAATS